MKVSLYFTSVAREKLAEHNIKRTVFPVKNGGEKLIELLDFGTRIDFKDIASFRVSDMYETRSGNIYWVELE